MLIALDFRWVVRLRSGRWASYLEHIPHWHAILDPLNHGPQWATSPLPDGERSQIPLPIGEGLGEGVWEANQEFALARFLRRQDAAQTQGV
jgi:hypothetical protein